MTGLAAVAPVAALRGQVNAASPAPTGLEMGVEYADGYRPADEEMLLPPEAERKSRALALFYRGRMHESNMEVAKALEDYEKVLKDDPENIALARRVARIHGEADRKAEAERVLKASLKANPDRYSAYLNLSNYYLIYARKPDQALRFARRAAEKFPDEPRVHAKLIELHLLEEKPAEAAGALETALGRNVADAGYWAVMGRLAQRVWKDDEDDGKKRLQRINGVYLKGLAATGNDDRLMREAGRFYNATRQFAKAEALYRKAIAAHPEMLSTREQLARVLLSQGKKDEAVKELRALARIDPSRVSVLLMLAGIAQQKKEFGEAIEHLEKAISVDSSKPEVFLGLSQLLLRNDKPERAVVVLRRARLRFPGIPNITYLLGLAQYQAKDYMGALDTFELTEEEARDDHPTLLDTDFYQQFGAAAERARQFDRAATLLQKSIKLDEDGASQARNYLGYMWVELDIHLEEAGNLIRRAVKADPRNGAFADSLAWYHFRKGAFEKALEELQRAEKLLEEPDAVIFDHLGQVLLKLDRMDEAFAYFDKAEKLDPKNPLVLADIAQAWATRGEADKAKGFVDRALAAAGESDDDVIALLAAADALEQSGEAQRALDVLLPLLKRFPADHPTLKRVARLARKMDNPSLAAKHLEKAAKLKPDDQTIRKMLQEFEKAKDKPAPNGEPDTPSPKPKKKEAAKPAKGGLRKL